MVADDLLTQSQGISYQGMDLLSVPEIPQIQHKKSWHIEVRSLKIFLWNFDSNFIEFCQHWFR